MAITIVQSNFHSNPFTGVTSGTATGSLTNPVASGNAVLIGFAGAGNSAALTVGTVTDNQSNTYPQATYDNSVTSGQGWFLKTNITNAPNTSFSAPFTVSSSSPTIVVAVYEISGLGLTPADYANLQSSGFATTFNLAFTTVAVNEMGFAILSNANGSGQAAVTMTNGWTADSTNLAGNPRSVVAHVALPTSGSNSIQGSTTSGDLWNVSIVSLQPGSVAPPPTSYFLESTEYF